MNTELTPKMEQGAEVTPETAVRTLTMAEMQADAEKMLSEFEFDYKRMAE